MTIFTRHAVWTGGCWSASIRRKPEERQDDRIGNVREWTRSCTGIEASQMGQGTRASRLKSNFHIVDVRAFVLFIDYG